MSETLLIDPTATRRALRDQISRKVMQDLFSRWKPKSFGPAYAVRVPEKDGTLNGTRMLMSGLDKVEVCAKMGVRAEIIDLTRDEFDEFTLAARMIDNLRLTECEQLQGAIYASDQARKYTREMQSVSGGDKKSAAAKTAKTAFSDQESLSAQWAESDSDAKNEDSATLTANSIAHKFFPQLPVRTIERGKEIRKKHPEVYRRFLAGEFSTVSDLRGAVNESVRTKRVAITMERYERAVRKSASNLQILVGDNATVLAKQQRILPKATVAFCDVPYNNGWKYDSDPTGDNLSDGDYISHPTKGLRRSFLAIRDALADNGTLYVLSSCKYAGLIDWMLRGMKFHYRETFAYWNHFPNNQPGRHPEAFKPLQVWTKHKTKYIFHPPPVESVRNAIGDPRGLTGGKIPDNVMAIRMLPGNSGKRIPFDDMPPLLPKELPMRCILTSSEPGDVVLDPYSGNGTTAVAALQAGRISINIERSQKYVDQSRIMIDAAMAEGISPYFKALIAGVVPPAEENGRCGACGGKIGGASA